MYVEPVLGGSSSEESELVARESEFRHLHSKMHHDGFTKLGLDIQVSLVQCTTQAEAKIYSEIQKSYKEDAWCQPLIPGAAGSIDTNHGKNIVLNQLIYYIGRDERYLLYMPTNARLNNSKIALRQQLI